jgi:hypothetical protein
LVHSKHRGVVCLRGDFSFWGSLLQPRRMNILTIRVGTAREGSGLALGGTLRRFQILAQLLVLFAQPLVLFLEPLQFLCRCALSFRAWSRSRRVRPSSSTSSRIRRIGLTFLRNKSYCGPNLRLCPAFSLDLVRRPSLLGFGSVFKYKTKQLRNF